ncbi:unnamed protein product [Mytilus coruscus]|uniref:Uncharacterized protein n=1 Tax=Mytilus coruscus TaxID=42192 RepID=A0A6J7ZXQ7_MYTCO|nr:unnamed protein product [Mytilus coruscus]
MVDQFTANKIASLQEQARKESEQLSAILSDHKTALDKAYALDNRKKSIEKQSRHDGTFMQMLKTLNEDIDKLEVCPLPIFPSATFISKFVKENDISQLLGTYGLCETKTGTARKLEIMSLPKQKKIYECSKCGKQKIKDPYARYLFNHFTCCQMYMEKKNIYK